MHIDCCLIRVVLSIGLATGWAGITVGCASSPSRAPEEATHSSDIATTGHAVAYVDEDLLPVHLAPSSTSKVTNRFGRGQLVEVLETKGDWSRVSQYYDGAVEGESGRVARWVRSRGLTSSKPAIVQTVTSDSRIEWLPNVGVSGITQRDVDILHAASLYYLESGRAERITFGDKSLYRPGMYYLNFDKPTNHFFRPSDIPNLEERINRLKQ